MPTNDMVRQARSLWEAARHKARCGVAFCALSLGLACGPSAAGPPPTAPDRLAAAVAGAGLAPAAFSTAPGAGGTARSTVGFPNHLREDPVGGVSALERLEVELPSLADQPPSAIGRLLNLAHGDTRWLIHAEALWHASSQKRPRADAGQPPDWPRHLPTGLRRDLLGFLSEMDSAQAWRWHALARWPVAVGAQDLQRQFIPGTAPAEAIGGAHKPAAAPAPGKLAEAIDLHALAAGMLQLTAAVERLKAGLAEAPPEPARWRLDSPLGSIVIDTTPSCNVYRGQQPLLLVDYGGNDTYAFDEVRPEGITVLLDLDGDDAYLAGEPGSDPSSAILGYAVLWDAAGDDHYKGRWLTQGAALFGAAALIDDGGEDRYEALGMAQGFAWAGLGVLIDRRGHDRYTALAQAQASAAPGGVALLLDLMGDDRYTLADAPLVLPSAQLPGINASLGQGAGYGMRDAADREGPAIPGGLALLMDFRGDDLYEAQVFAQGVGYEGGLGVLIDGGGSDRMRASWYAMGAAAHRAGGVMIARGRGRDSYSVSHVTALGAAHDGSTAVFVGGQGDDSYLMGALGMGAAHDGGAAIFIEQGGDDHYALTQPACRAFGVSEKSSAVDAQPSAAQPPPANVALFIDRAGRDSYPGGCPGKSDGMSWETTGKGGDSGLGRDSRPARPRHSPGGPRP